MSAPIKSCSRWRQTKSGKLVGGNTPPYSLRELKTREDWNEWQANVLGAAILMPQREIDLAVAYYARGRKLVSYDGTYAYWDKVALDMICQQFGVSKTAAVIRLRQLGHLETRQYNEYNDPLEVWA